MKKSLVLFALGLAFLTCNRTSAQSIYLATGGSASFFAESTVENIDATTSSLTSVLNITTGEVVFTVPMRTFKFKKSLMEEHFNEKYVESEKYPKSIYKAKLKEKIDLTKDGVYPVTVDGTFDLHGVTNNASEKGIMTVKGGKIDLESNFKIALKDYKIEIPSIVASTIPDTINVKMKCQFQPYVKTK